MRIITEEIRLGFVEAEHQKFWQTSAIRVAMCYIEQLLVDRIDEGSLILTSAFPAGSVAAWCMSRSNRLEPGDMVGGMGAAS